VGYIASVVQITTPQIAYLVFRVRIIFLYFETPISYFNAGVVVVNSGANPTIVSYNASAVKNFNATLP
jgi:hypothetical protein